MLYSNLDAIRLRLDMLSRATASGSIFELKALIESHPEFLVGRLSKDEVVAIAAEVAVALKAKAAERERRKLALPVQDDVSS